MKIVLESYSSEISLIRYRRQLLDAGAKSVEIQFMEPCETSQSTRTLQYRLLKDLQQIADNDAEDFEKLDDGMPVFLKVKFRAEKDDKGVVHHKRRDFPRLWWGVRETSEQKDGTILIHLNQQDTSEFTKIKGDPSDRVAIWLEFENLIIATPTLESLRKGSFNINLQFNSAERKILLDSLERSPGPKKMHGGLLLTTPKRYDTIASKRIELRSTAKQVSLSK